MRRITLLLATVVALCTGFATSASAGTIFFQLKVQHTLKCLQVSGGTTAVQSTCGGFQQQNQIFVLDPLPNGNHRIRNVSTNRCLDIRGANPATGADVIEFTCTAGAKHQEWGFGFDGAGHYEVVSALNQKCLDVDTFGGGTNNGARVQMWDCLDNPALNQRWNLQSI
ncbi:RICIN domain-containing protein [Lentzea sp. NPDC042327]|uniref:RICIN domain-containing protein n=1 Tax=Lentzea sp. NPDC042327 TaxID=3154801 RepID=UPI0033F874DD